jgi:hypothetical protein
MKIEKEKVQTVGRYILAKVLAHGVFHGCNKY